jgi:hypothetical protein
MAVGAAVSLRRGILVGRLGRASAMVAALCGVALWLGRRTRRRASWGGGAGRAGRRQWRIGAGDRQAEEAGQRAQSMADTLKGLGFEVALVTDADQKGLRCAIREFGQKLRETGGTAAAAITICASAPRK